MRALNAVVALAIAFVALVASDPPTAKAADCGFVLGFAALHDLIPDVVGDCIADEYHNPQNGDGLQETTGGLLVWRKADNWTAFTDGYRTWINGPYGLQQRLNAERFDWEADGSTVPTAVTSSSLIGAQVEGFRDDAGLSQLEGSGVRWARVILPWGPVEPSEDSYDWSSWDRRLAQAPGTEVTVIGVLHVLPEWASEQELEPGTDKYYNVRVRPDKLYAYKEFLKQAVRHTLDKGYNVKYWEIFNEVDNQRPLKADHLSTAYGAHPDMYAELLKASKEAITSVDPQAKIVFGGLAMESAILADGRVLFNTEFLDQVSAYIANSGDDASQYFDVAAIHVYPYWYINTWPSADGSTPGLVGKVNHARQMMRNHGIDRPLMITETSMSVQSPGPDASKQAAFAVRVFVEGAVVDAPAVIWWPLADIDIFHFGLLDSSLQPRPSYWATRYLASRLEGASYLGPTSGLEVVCGKAVGFSFSRPAGNFHLLWGAWTGFTDDEGPVGGDALVRLPGNRARIVDMLGNDAGTVEGSGGTITLTLTYRPVYVEIEGETASTP